MKVVWRIAGVPAAMTAGEQTPPVQLQDPAAHQGVRGEGVGAVAGTIDDEDPQSLAGEQHRRRRPSSAGADNDGVVVRRNGHHGAPE